MFSDFPESLVPIIAIVSVFGFLTISAVAHYGYKAYCFGQLTRLKERLLESGMSSGEIERVVNAGNLGEGQDSIREKKIA